MPEDTRYRQVPESPLEAYTRTRKTFDSHLPDLDPTERMERVSLADLS